MTPEEKAIWRRGYWVGVRAGLRWYHVLEKLFAIAGCLLLVAVVVVMLLAIGLA